MAFTTIVTFWAIALLLIVVPGPDWAFTLGATLRGEPVMAPVAGLVVGYAALTAVVSAGIGALVADRPAMLTALTLVGGGYLMWQAVLTLRRPSTPLADHQRAPGRSTVLAGIGVSGLNPKALLLFLALLPQFTTPHSSWPVALQVGLLGTVFTLTCAAFYTVLGTFARRIQHSRPAAGRAMTRLSGAGMFILGLLLIVEHLAR
jgi:threonine/homoserine/homoserine lactone efflux protein